MIFESSFTVRGYELDSFGHLNNSVYINYLEQARWDILRKNEDIYQYFTGNNVFLAVIETNIRYIREARIFDELLVKTRIEKENPYVNFFQDIYNRKSNLKISKAVVKTLLVDSERIPMDFPDEIFDKMNC